MLPAYGRGPSAVHGILRPWWQLSGFIRVRGTDRFWRKVQKTRLPGECWPWLNGRSASGYGVIHWHGRHVYAHRLAYELYHDCTVPAHLVVRHKCDNPLCCRPSHLEVGTRYENSQDMVERGRRRTGVLSRAEVLDIRQLYRDHTPICEICARFHITQKAVWHVVRRQSYRHIPEAA